MRYQGFLAILEAEVKMGQGQLGRAVTINGLTG